MKALRSHEEHWLSSTFTVPEHGYSVGDTFIGAIQQVKVSKGRFVVLFRSQGVDQPGDGCFWSDTLPTRWDQAIPLNNPMNTVRVMVVPEDILLWSGSIASFQTDMASPCFLGGGRQYYLPFHVMEALLRESDKLLSSSRQDSDFTTFFKQTGKKQTVQTASQGVIPRDQGGFLAPNQWPEKFISARDAQHWWIKQRKGLFPSLTAQDEKMDAEFRSRLEHFKRQIDSIHTDGEWKTVQPAFAELNKSLTNLIAAKRTLAHSALFDRWLMKAISKHGINYLLAITKATCLTIYQPPLSQEATERVRDLLDCLSWFEKLQSTRGEPSSSGVESKMSSAESGVTQPDSVWMKSVFALLPEKMRNTFLTQQHKLAIDMAWNRAVKDIVSNFKALLRTHVDAFQCSMKESHADPLFALNKLVCDLKILHALCTRHYHLQVAQAMLTVLTGVYDQVRKFLVQLHPAWTLHTWEDVEKLSETPTLKQNQHNCFSSLPKPVAALVQSLDDAEDKKKSLSESESIAMKEYVGQRFVIHKLGGCTLNIIIQFSHTERPRPDLIIYWYKIIYSWSST